MAVSNVPIFEQAPKIGGIATQVSVANTARDGSGTLVDIVTGGTNGTRIDHIDIQAAGAVTDGVIRLFLFSGSGTARLWREILVQAITPSATIQAWSASIDCSLNGNRLVLPSGYVLRASTHNAETFNVIAHGGDL
jgi:hypothetical protein